MGRESRWLSRSLFVAAAVVLVAAFGFWFTAIWTQGPAAGRVAGTGLLAAMLSGILAVAGVCAQENGR